MTPTKTTRQKKIDQLKTSLAISIITAILILIGTISKKVKHPVNTKQHIEQVKSK